MNILVTGGAGFIGSPLVKKLVEIGHNVTVVDNLSRGKIENIEKVLDKIQFVKWDMKKPRKFDKFDIVFDLAARIYGITKLYENESSFLNENTRILLNTLECLKDKTKHYFYVSSSCIYNYNGCPKPHKEIFDKVIPKTGYDISKRFGEEMIKIYAKQHKFKYTIIRPFNVFGPNEGEEAPHVIRDFNERIIKEKNNPTNKFWILGSGEQTRSFTYVTDLVDALIFLMNHKTAENEIFNVGTQVETKIIDLLKTMFKISGLEFDKYEINHKPPLPHDVQERNPNVSKLFALGWKPKYTLEKGLKEIWKIEGV